MRVQAPSSNRINNCVWSWVNNLKWCSHSPELIHSNNVIELRLPAPYLIAIFNTLYFTLTRFWFLDSIGLMMNILKNHEEESWMSVEVIWWTVSSQDWLSYELLKICRCDRAPREAGWTEFSVGCLTRPINKWTHQCMSERDIRRDTLDGLRVKNKSSRYQVSGRGRCSTSDCFEEDGPHCATPTWTKSIWQKSCPLMPRW